MNGARPSSARLAEAGLALTLASLAIWIVPFRLLARSTGVQAGSTADAATITAIRRALAAWTRRLPWRTLCFEQGLAAHWLLRRRGLASTLFYGAASVDGELKAHVWVRSGERDVIGCDNASHYALLASFPAAHSSLSVKPVSDKHSS